MRAVGRERKLLPRLLDAADSASVIHRVVRVIAPVGRRPVALTREAAEPAAGSSVADDLLPFAPLLVEVVVVPHALDERRRAGRHGARALGVREHGGLRRTLGGGGGEGKPPHRARLIRGEVRNLGDVREGGVGWWFGVG